MIVMELRTKRIYDKPSSDDGLRVLVDRLWPRGVKKEKAVIDLWLKEAAPSDSLRKTFSHEPGQWEEFRKLYFEELSANPGPIRELALKAAGKGRVTLLYASRDTERNNAVALKEYLSKGGRLKKMAA